VNYSSGSRLLAGLALVAVAATGCASTDSGTTNDSADATASPTGAASSKSASTATADASPSTTMTSGSAGSGAPSDMAEPASCHTRDLRVTVSAGEGAAGSTYYSVRLRNTSTHPCRTGGFGGVSLVRAPHGAPVGAPADRAKQGAAKQLTLRPGGRAEATLRVTNADNYPAGRCRPTPVKGLRVYPPNETRSAYVAQATTACRSAKVHLLTLEPYKPIG
jgi:Protein of unknown function (DUF4232)